MSKYRMTEVLSESEETLYEYLKTHCEEYHNEEEDWQDTFDEVANFECGDWIHEIADSSVPVYTYDIMECAMEDMSLATDVPEIGPAFDGSQTAANIIASNIYEKVCNYLYDMEQSIKRRVVDNYKWKEDTTIEVVNGKEKTIKQGEITITTKESNDGSN